MRKLFAQMIALALAESPDNNIIKKMKYTKLSLINMVWFFGNHTIREQIIPGFNDAIDILTNTRMYNYTAVEKFYTNTYHKPQNIHEFDRHFWSEYVRDCIHTFLVKAFGSNKVQGGQFISNIDARDIFNIANKLQSNHTRYSNIKEWKQAIKHDYTLAYEVLYSGLFDVKMSYSGEKNKVYLYSYGPKSQANCIAFAMRCAWNRIQAKTM